MLVITLLIWNFPLDVEIEEKPLSDSSTEPGCSCCTYTVVVVASAGRILLVSFTASVYRGSPQAPFML